MPEGVQQADIDPTTGQLAKADTATKRPELFIGGTLPGSDKVDETEATAEEAPPETEGDQSGKSPQTEPATLPDPLPTEPPRAKPTPRSKIDSHEFYDGDPSPKLQGTITLDIDPTTGLIAVDSCPVIRTKTFVIGQEPRKYCGPEYHKKAQPSPAPATRSRLANP